MINVIKENDENDKTEIVLSNVIQQNCQDLEDEINELKKKLENLCKGKGMRFMDKSHIKSSSLSRSKLHLNKSGIALRNTDGNVNNLTKDSSFIASNVSHLGNFKLKTPKNIIFSNINTNSICNKFEDQRDIIGNNVDVLSITETKRDSLFPNANSYYLDTITL